MILEFDGSTVTFDGQPVGDPQEPYAIGTCKKIYSLYMSIQWITYTSTVFLNEEGRLYWKEVQTIVNDYVRSMNS